jgi:molecular chaperone DnaK
MSVTAFGIDLGTSTSIVSYLDRERPVTIGDPTESSRSPIVPSEVGLSTRDNQLLVGSDVREKSAAPNKIIREAKRYMGTDHTYDLDGQFFTSPQVASLVLKKLKANAEQVTGHALTEAVITVPAYFDDIPRRATEMAAHMAGIKVLRLISEPVAAAIAYGMNKLDEEANLVVFDFGGGTLDVTVIEMVAGVLDVKATHGDRQLGGKDIDQAFMEYVVKAAGAPTPKPGTKYFEELRSRVIKAKKSLSTDLTCYVDLDGFRDETTGSLIAIELQVSRAQFDNVVKPFVDRAIQCVVEAIHKAGLQKSEVTRILLVGGTCYIPKVRESVENFFALKAEPGVDPDLAVSQGAAISAGLKTGLVNTETSVLVQDASTFRIGTSSLADVGGQRMLLFSELMPANAKIPFVRTVRYSLQRTNQDTVEIDVLIDPSNNAVFPEDAKLKAAVGLIEDIPPSPTGEPHAIDVEIQYDENHIVRVSAKVVGTDNKLTLKLQEQEFMANSVVISEQMEQVELLWEKMPQASRNAPLISRTERLIAENPQHAEKLEALVHTLKQGIHDGDDQAIKASRQQLVDYIDSIQ